MHGSTNKWLARLLTSVLTCGTAAMAFGQQGYAPAPVDPGYGMTYDANQAGPAANYFVSNANMADDKEKSLEARVKELEAALKKINDKAADDKKKAASKPTANPGGLIQIDTAAFDNQNAASQAAVGDAVNGTEFRRARLWVSGEAFQVYEYKAEFEFASTSRPTFKDVYIAITQLPYLQNVRVGHFKEPFGLEQLTSDRFTTFMERSLSDEGFIVPGRNTGAMAYGWTENERATWAIGAFVTDQIDNPAVYPPPTALLPSGVASAQDGDQTSVTMRGTWLPWYDEATEGRGLWHLGTAYSYRATSGYRNAANVPVLAPYQVRPEAHLAPVILSNTGLTAFDTQLLGVETAVVYGPLSLQGELFLDFVDRPNGLDDPTYSGCYGYVSYFLTGEHRPYNRRGGYFDRVKPYTNFFRVRTEDCDIQTGWGAWEVGYRASYTDMYGGTPQAQRIVGMGTAFDHTFGVNWYLSPYTRLMANYVITNFDRVNTAGGPLVDNLTLNTFEMRAQLDF